MQDVLSLHALTSTQSVQPWRPCMYTAVVPEEAKAAICTPPSGEKSDPAPYKGGALCGMAGPLLRPISPHKARQPRTQTRTSCANTKTALKRRPLIIVDLPPPPLSLVLLILLASVSYTDARAPLFLSQVDLHPTAPRPTVLSTNTLARCSLRSSFVCSLRSSP